MQSKPARLDIELQQWQTIQNILRQYLPDTEVWAFGSRIKGNAKRYSDLDLAVITTRSLALATQSHLAKAFSESDLPWRVDIVDWASATEQFKQVILQDYAIIKNPYT